MPQEEYIGPGIRLVGGAAMIVSGITTSNWALAIGGLAPFLAGITGLASLFDKERPRKIEERDRRSWSGISETNSREASIPLIYGRIKTEGNLIHESLLKENDQWILYRLVGLSEGPIEDVKEVLIDGMRAEEYNRLYGYNVTYEFLSGHYWQSPLVAGKWASKFYPVNKKILPIAGRQVDYEYKYYWLNYETHTVALETYAECIKFRFFFPTGVNSGKGYQEPGLILWRMYWKFPEDEKWRACFRPIVYAGASPQKGIFSLDFWEGTIKNGDTINIETWFIVGDRYVRGVPWATDEEKDIFNRIRDDLPKWWETDNFEPCYIANWTIKEGERVERYIEQYVGVGPKVFRNKFESYTWREEDIPWPDGRFAVRKADPAITSPHPHNYPFVCMKITMPDGKRLFSFFPWIEPYYCPWYLIMVARVSSSDFHNVNIKIENRKTLDEEYIDYFYLSSPVIRGATFPPDLTTIAEFAQMFHPRSSLPQYFASQDLKLTFEMDENTTISGLGMKIEMPEHAETKIYQTESTREYNVLGPTYVIGPLDFKVERTDHVSRPHERIKWENGEMQYNSDGDEMEWEYIIAEKARELRYPNTAVCLLKIPATENFEDSPPRSEFIVEGLKCPDLDLEDPFSERKWTDNPIEILLDFLTNYRYGLGKYIKRSDIDLESFKSAKAWVDGKGYKFNAILTEESPFDIVSKILTACRCYMVIREKVFVYPDVWKFPVKVLTEDDILADDGRSTLSVRKYPRTDRPNILEIQYSDENLHFERNTVRLVDEKRIEEEGGFLKKSISIFGATNRQQVEDIGKYIMNVMKYVNFEVEFALGLKHFDLEPGDIVNIKHKLVGDRNFRITSISVSSIDRLQVRAMEVQDATYVYTAAKAVDTPSEPSPADVLRHFRVLPTGDVALGALQRSAWSGNMEISLRPIGFERGWHVYYEDERGIKVYDGFIKRDPWETETKYVLKNRTYDQNMKLFIVPETSFGKIANVGKSVGIRLSRSRIPIDILKPRAVEIYRKGNSDISSERSFHISWVGRSTFKGFARKPMGFEEGIGQVDETIKGYKVIIKDGKGKVLYSKETRDNHITIAEDEIKGYTGKYFEDLKVEILTLDTDNNESKPETALLSSSIDMEYFNGKHYLKVHNKLDLRVTKLRRLNAV